MTDLQKDLLDQNTEPSRALEALSRLASQAPAAVDSELGQVLDAIRLRAKIELVRRGVEIT